MATQIIGRDFKSFYADRDFWPENGETYHDDIMLLVDGRAMGEIDTDLIGDASIIQIESGWVDAIPAQVGRGKVDMSLSDYYELWRALNAAGTRLMFECSPDVREKVVAAAIAAGATLIA